jgi:glycine cleavage system H protein
MVPADLRYTKDHEWVRVEGDEATVGITDYAAQQLGDIVFVELPEAGRTLAQFAAFGVVESVKAVSDLFAPLTGEVTATNDALGGSPELVNSEPYGGGWMVKLRLSEPGELDELLDAAAYDALIATG